MTQGDSKRDSSNKELEKKRKQAAKAAARSHKEREKKAKKKEKADRIREKSRSAAIQATLGNNKKTKRRQSNTTRRNIWLLILTTVLIIASVVMFTPPSEKINQGLDIRGGLSVVLSAQSTDGEEVTPEETESSRQVIESRVNALGASEATVQVQGNNQILVQIPGLSDTERALATIGKTGKLEFARADSFTNPADQQAIAQDNYVAHEAYRDVFGNTFIGQNTQYRPVEPGTYTPLITGANIERVTVGKASETGTDYAVNIKLDAEGTEKFAEATRELAPDKGKIVIVLDNEIQSAPAVQAEIPTGDVQITGGYSLEDAQAFATVLESGSLPVSFHYEQSQVVGPTLGQDALMSGLLVAIIGLLVVMVYLLFFYKGLGILTAAAITIFAILYLGLLATLSAFGFFSLSLAGVAGIVLTIGLAADSSILTLERFREEIRMGRSVRAASITGVKHAIQTSIDADLVTLVSALTLFFLASASVKGFGLTLSLGIFCDILVLIIFKAPMIRLLAPRVIARHPKFWDVQDAETASETYQELADAEGVSVEEAETGEAMDRSIALMYAKRAGELAVKAREKVEALKGRFIKHDIGFMGVRKILLSVSAVLIVLSFALIGIRGINFGIEFVGGTSINFHGTGDVSIDQMREAFANAGEPEAVVQTTNTDGQDGFLIRTTTTSAEEAAETANNVAQQLKISDESFEVTTIGPDWGAGVIQSSLIAFFVSLLLIILYIAIRFEYKMGLMAVVALLHDLVIVIGAYALFGREFTPNAVAALLTILGYSLYDTVVVFHRIVDNMKESRVRCTFMTMANHSINQVLIRTINTTLTSLIPVLAMLFFGGETLKDFAFAMAVGLIAGSYSSIAVATPLYAMWKSREPKYKKLIKRFGDSIGQFSYTSGLAVATSAVGADGAEMAVDGAEFENDAQSAQTAKKQAKPAAKQENKPIRYKRKKKE